MAQADALDAMLEDIGRELGIVFELQLDDESAVRRLLRRAAEEGRRDDTPDVSPSGSQPTTSSRSRSSATTA